MDKGYVQVYTGNGKGKTTAALGLALRAAGAGFRVFFAQFLKQRECSEHKVLERFRDLIVVKQYGSGFILNRKVSESDIRAAGQGLQEIGEIVRHGDYDLVILDEINIAVHYKLLEVADLLRLMAEKARATELVITGRYAHQLVLGKADLVTTMEATKHYLEAGVKARRGIEF